MKTPFLLWMMGPTSSGKSTLAEALHAELTDDGIRCMHFDGDEFRDLFGAGYGFRKEDRLRVVKALAHFANKAVAAGTNAIVSALTAAPEARAFIRENCPDLIVCHVKCSIEECIERDPKGLYARAIKGEIDTLIGYNTEYMPPESPDIAVDTTANGVRECVNLIRQALEQT